MGEYEKHIRMAREKLKAVRIAFEKGQHTVVGDLGYDGVNGDRAKKAIENLDKILNFFKNRFGEQIEE